MDEAVNAKMSAFHVVNKRCWFQALGKGKKLRAVPVPDAMVQSLADYRLAYELEPPFPSPNDKRVSGPGGFHPKATYPSRRPSCS